MPWFASGGGVIAATGAWFHADMARLSGWRWTSRSRRRTGENDVLKLDVNKIGLKGSPTQVRRIFAPKRDKGEIVEGGGERMGNAVDAVFKKLMDWDFISLEK